MSEKINGITYYSLESNYSGDTTKNCGLTAREIDGNFYFLRGLEISDLEWDGEEKRFVLTKMNGETLKTDSVDLYISESVEMMVSSITDSIELLRCEISGFSESVEGIYDEIDARLAQFESGLTEFRQEIESNTDRKIDEVVGLFNSGLTNVIDVANRALDLSNLNTELIGQLSTSTENAIFKIKDEIERKSVAISERIDRAKSDVERKMAEMHDELTSAITDNSCRIDSIESTLEKMTDSVSGNTGIVGILSSDTVNALSELRSDVDAKYNELNRKIDDAKADADKRIKGVNDTLSEKITSNSDRIDAIEQGSERLGARFTNLSEKVDTLSSDTVSAIGQLSKDVDKKTRELSDSIDDNKSRIDDIEAEIADMGGSFSGQTGVIHDLSAATENALGELRKHVDRVESSLDDKISQGDSELDGKISKLASNVANEFDEIEEDIDTINDELKSIRDTLSGLTGGMPDFGGDDGNQGGDDNGDGDEDGNGDDDNGGDNGGDDGNESGDTPNQGGGGGLIFDYIDKVVKERTESLEKSLTIEGNDVEI